MTRDKACSADLCAIDPRLSKRAGRAAGLGFDVVEFLEFLQEVDRRSARPAATTGDVAGSVQELIAFAGGTREELETLAQLSAGTRGTAAGSVERLNGNARRAREIAGRVQGPSDRNADMDDAVAASGNATAGIVSIARQVHGLGVATQAA